MPVKKFALVCATASALSCEIGSGFTSMRPRIHGTGPGAGVAGGGAAGVATCCANKLLGAALAATDAAMIPLKKSRLCMDALGLL